MVFDGKRLRAARIGRRLSQDELAAASGVPQGTISSLERGKIERPAVDSLIALARALDLDHMAFLDEQAEVPRSEVEEPDALRLIEQARVLIEQASRLLVRERKVG